jgi:hypothetical protein
MKRITAGIAAAALLTLVPAASAAPGGDSQAPVCSGGSGDVTITTTDKDISSYWFDGQRGSAIDVRSEARDRALEINSDQTFSTITVKLGASTFTFDASCAAQI